MKAVLFDFDGVIVDSERARLKALRHILKEKERELNILISEFAGKKTEKILADCFPEMAAGEITKIAEKRRIMQDMPPLVPGIKELLSYLKPRFEIALVTGSVEEIVQKIFRHYSLDRYFDLVVSGNRYGKSKEDPECYILTLKELGIKPAEAVAIEDSQAGIVSAKGAGITALGLETYGRLAGADSIFRSHAELLRHFKKEAHII